MDNFAIAGKEYEMKIRISLIGKIIQMIELIMNKSYFANESIRCNNKFIDSAKVDLFTMQSVCLGYLSLTAETKQGKPKQGNERFI